jgi:hypothetical protein
MVRKLCCADDVCRLEAFGPFSRSNSTVSPSLSVRYPFSWIAEKCTNTSSPVERWINPYPRKTKPLAKWSA